MRSLAAIVVALALPSLAASATATSGLRGLVLIDPGYPVCKVNVPCTRPARNVLLVFSRNGRVVARIRTGPDGSYRIRLRPGAYTVSSPAGKTGRPGLQPRHVTVPVGRYKRVIFKLDIGLQ